MKWDESNIIIGIKKGEQIAFKQLFLEYYSTICHFLFRILNDFSLAEDVAQEIFMKIWIKRLSLDESKSIKGLLYVMAKNAALNLLRQKKQHIVRGIGDLNLASDKRADDAAQLKDLANSIADCIESMPAQRQKVFIQSRVGQMSNKEIAELTNLSVRTVEKHLELAMKDIKKANIS
ncbi:MAG: RNA polymerase sigma-70 factor [Bacteroidales bacterium]|nr:RNA polymerase sigma-70 factor [Candidatus Cacconaster merdequi]